MSVYELDRHLQTWLAEGRYKDIFAFCEALESGDPPLRPETQRVLNHYQAMAYIYLGAPNKAKQFYLKALEFGENISLQRDLACCYYLLDEIDEWRQSYQFLEATLHRSDIAIQDIQTWRAQLILGKFYEEEGLIHKAREYYQETWKAALIANNTTIVQQALPQLLRVLALFTNSDEISSLYAQLVDIDTSKISPDLTIEMEHSLMLAELYLIGPNHAWTRVQAAFTEPYWSEEDRRLILFDFAEEVLMRKETLPMELTSFISSDWSLSAHEEQILRFIQNPNEVKIHWLNRLAPRLSAACRLRGLFLFLASQDSGDLQKEVHRKIQLLLGVLPVEARGYWLHKVEPYYEKTDLTITVDPKMKKLTYQNKELDLSRKKGMLQIMSELGGEPSLSVDALIEHLWSTDYSPEHFHRLRMTIHRLNNLLFDLTSIQKVVEFDSEKVKIHPSINISTLNN